MPSERILGTRTNGATIYSNSSYFEETDAVDSITYARYENNDTDAILVIKIDATGATTKRYTAISIWGNRATATYTALID